MTSAALIRQARRAAGLTQTEVAARLGVSQPVVARLESRSSNPTWETLSRALQATGHEIQLVHRPAVSHDLGQLRERLALTPGERLRTFQESQRNLEQLRTKARRRGDG